MGNRFADGVQAAKERTAELEANKKQEEKKAEVVEQSAKETTPTSPLSESADNKLDIKKIFSETPKKKKAVAKTFYMSEANMEKLEKLAKSQKMSVSKVLNEILSNVL